MIGTRLDDVDAPRMIRTERGWWFIGNGTWTLLKPEHVLPDGSLRADIDTFLRDEGAFRERTTKSFSLTVLTSTACNLGCGYCFQNTGQDPEGGHRPPRIERQLLDTRTIDRIVGFTAPRMADAGLERLFLLLFGGEPLLNPAGCLELLRRCRSIGLHRAAMTSNGVLLHPRRAVQLHDAGLQAVQITFDGSRTDHDATRVTHTGGGTFDRIVANVASATERTGLRWNFRVNVSHHNADRVGELFAQLEGRTDPSRCTVTFAWVGDSGIGYQNDLGRTASVADRFVEWSIESLERGYRVVRPSMHTTCQICSTPGGAQGAVVNADGTLFSSWQSAGKPGMEVGHIDHGYLDPTSVPERWVSCGYEYAQADTGVMDRFQDEVDGRVLDYLLASGRL
ncbi:radical SAM protein [Kitasatospora sp. NBC_01250]|uniref:radical SAM protein n=1 Tax=unclassified Kitasatospora TaxID=2633591 RepID=UPI002E12020F|nr:MULTISPECIES: radical SAM protein [unclassified Kitasatospora]WSJ64917.1 radical SAM protein [Kitasatospora sp. NBC_01302]